MRKEEGQVYDELLVLLAQDGDARALERLAARWQPRFLIMARRLMRSDELARDTVQEAWLSISEGIAPAEGPIAVSGLELCHPEPTMRGPLARCHSRQETFGRKRVPRAPGRPGRSGS